MLAGVIGNELAHIFYRHPGDRSRGLWGEIVGALPIDRKQEQQADVLGAGLACQAGNDPDGLVKFMQLLIANTGKPWRFWLDASIIERVHSYDSTGRTSMS